MLDLLIKLAEIIELNLRGANDSKKIDAPDAAPKRSSKPKKTIKSYMFKSSNKTDKQELYTDMSSADIATKYLPNLNENVFQTVLACIKDNIESCKILCKYDEIFDI